jgi:hypothetical protein
MLAFSVALFRLTFRRAAWQSVSDRSVNRKQNCGNAREQDNACADAGKTGEDIEE